MVNRFGVRMVLPPNRKLLTSLSKTPSAPLTAGFCEKGELAKFEV
jgi:hypothetical protein